MSFTLGSVLAVIVLVAAIVLGIEHSIPEKEAILFGVLAVAILT